jgi:hypothetical protein
MVRRQLAQSGSGVSLALYPIYLGDTLAGALA